MGFWWAVLAVATGDALLIIALVLTVAALGGGLAVRTRRRG